MSLTDFFQYIAEDRRTAALATELADAYSLHRNPAIGAGTEPGTTR